MKTMTLNEKAFIRLSITGALAGYRRGCLTAVERVVPPGPRE